MIPQRNLSMLSNRLLREQGGRRIPEAVLERDYCLSWVLIGLPQTRLAEWLIFKGGTALKKFYFPAYRFSEDLDFTLQVDIPWDAIEAELTRLSRHVRERSGVLVEFLERDSDSHSNSHTFYIGLRGPIPRSAPVRVKVDITIREHLCYQPEQRALLREYDEYSDIEGTTLPVYSLSEIAAEKILALLDSARNEPRDLYDLWYLSQNADIEWPELVECMATKYRFRGIDPALLVGSYDAKERRLQRLWSARLQQQIAVLPEFDSVYRELRRRLRPAELMNDVVSVYAGRTF